MGCLRLLEAIRSVDPKGMRFYQAGSSEMFGSSPSPQDESTPFRPRSLRLREGLRAPPDGQLPRGVRHLRRQRDPLQPRERAARRDVRHSAGHARRDADRGGPEHLYLGRSRRGATGAPATSSRACGGCSRRRSPTTTCSRRARTTACASGSTPRSRGWGKDPEARPVRPALRPPDRGRSPLRRRQGQGEEPGGSPPSLRRARAADGRTPTASSPSGAGSPRERRPCDPPGPRPSDERPRRPRSAGLSRLRDGRPRVPGLPRPRASSREHAER